LEGSSVGLYVPLLEFNLLVLIAGRRRGSV
jgi:hypothetical protein